MSGPSFTQLDPFGDVQQLHRPMPEEVRPQYENAVTKPLESGAPKKKAPTPLQDSRPKLVAPQPHAGGKCVSDRRVFNAYYDSRQLSAVHD
jgi:hypothetical protein